MKKHFKNFTYKLGKSCSLIIAIFLLSSLKQLDYSKSYNVKLQIVNSQNQEVTSFMVKIASNRRTRARGLMFINELPKDHGMLFEFEKEEQVTMWMKNTRINLDMIYIDKNNKIVDIYENAKAGSEDLIPPKYKSKRILEINGGLSKELGINTNQYIKIIK